MNCTRKSRARGPFGSRCCAQACRAGAGGQGRGTEPCWLLCELLGAPLLLLPPGLSLTRGGEEGTIVAPAQEPSPACRAVCVPRCAAEPCSPGQRQGSPTGRGWMHQRARGVHSGDPRASQGGSARALHPFHSMDNNIQAHIPVRQSSAPGRHPRARCGCCAEPGLGEETSPRGKFLFVLLGFLLSPPCRTSTGIFVRTSFRRGGASPCHSHVTVLVELLLGFGVPCMSSQYWFPPLLCRRCSLALQVLLVSIRKLGYIHNR